MKIILKEVTIKELSEGFEDKNELGVVGFNKRLNIRPAFQREFVYNYEQQKAVIDSIINSFPLNTMYWAKTIDGFEVLDGQQRTLSICYYINNIFAYESKLFDKPMYFDSLPKDIKEKILNYKLMIYICDGEESEKLKWFEIINLSGEPLTKQELRNAVYSGSWVNDAKRFFSKINGSAYNISKDFLNKSIPRQELLETAIGWVCCKDNLTIENYMSKHQNDKDAQELWVYFQKVINWIKINFIVKRKEMKSVDWGWLYNTYNNININPQDLEKEIQKLMMDSEVQKKVGIYTYVFDKNQKHLNLRVFDDNQKRTAFEKQNGTCSKCKKVFKIEEMEADHITPWSLGGRTTDDNLQMLCKECNRRKSNT